MKLIYAREPMPLVVPRSIFLMGPTPRSEEVPSWRPTALRLFRMLSFDGTIFIPEDRPDPDGVSRYRGSYDDQIEWEREALKRASVKLVWLPRDLATMPAFTTNIEWGMLWDSGQIVFGAPDDAPKTAYLRWYAALGAVPECATLPDTIASSLALLDTFERQDELCVFCRIAHEDSRGQVEQQLDQSVLFEPLGPVVPGHKLVVPRLHVASAADNPGVAAEAFRDAAEYVRREHLQANLITSVGRDATQSVFHLHIHVVPRYAGDHVQLPWSDQQRS